MTSEAPVGLIDVRKIMEFLPHRYPFLMVDRVVAFEPGVSITALKNVTINEPFFQGHFPGLPVMPGVLQLEALAQTCGVFIKSSYPEFHDKLFLFGGMDKVRFRRPVVPGDQLMLSCTDFRRKLSLFKMQCVASVEGKTSVSAELTGALVNREEM